MDCNSPIGVRGRSAVKTVGKYGKKLVNYSGERLLSYLALNNLTAVKLKLKIKVKLKRNSHRKRPLRHDLSYLQGDTDAKQYFSAPTLALAFEIYTKKILIRTTRSPNVWKPLRQNVCLRSQA